VKEPSEPTAPGPTEPDTRSAYADVNGVRLHYVSAGEGPLLLFLHGFPEFWYAWRRQLAAFGGEPGGPPGGWRAVALDMRGYNLSAKPAAVDAYRMSQLVEDVRALAEHLGYRRLTLVGHDWGGAVAWAFALRHPEWLERLVIVNAPHPAIFQRELAENPAQQEASRYMLMLRSPEAEAILSADDHAWLSQVVLARSLRRGHLTEADAAAYRAAWSQPGALTGGLNYYRAARVGPPAPGEAVADPAGARGFPTITVPTLVVWGERDRALLVGNLDGLEQHVTQLTVRRIPEGTHWVVHERSDQVHGYIRDFLGAP
jgi:pimeloyl-ACP methyl ester carboxylesterase